MNLRTEIQNQDAELTLVRRRAADPHATVPPWQRRVSDAEPDWFTHAPPKREYLIRDLRDGNAGVLPTGKVGMLIAEGGAGKTMALVELGIAVSTGTPWLGCYTTEQGRVLTILGEEDLEEVKRRSYNARRAVNAPIPGPGTYVMIPLAGVPCSMIESDQHGNPQDAEFLTWLRGYLTHAGPFALVLIDPLSRFAGADAETDNAAATRFVQALESIASESGATVIVAHHTNKSARGAGAAVTGAASRGSSAFYDGVRWVASLSVEAVQHADADQQARLGEIVTLAVQKSNYSRKGEPVLLRRDLDNAGALLPLDGFDEEAVQRARGGADPQARRQSQRDENARARSTVIAGAILDALRVQPGGMTYRSLRGAVQAAVGGCGDPGMSTGLAMLGSRVCTVPGPRGSVIHCLSAEG